MAIKFYVREMQPERPLEYSSDLDTKIEQGSLMKEALTYFGIAKR